MTPGEKELLDMDRLAEEAAAIWREVVATQPAATTAPPAAPSSSQENHPSEEAEREPIDTTVAEVETEIEQDEPPEIENRDEPLETPEETSEPQESLETERIELEARQDAVELPDSPDDASEPPDLPPEVHPDLPPDLPLPESQNDDQEPLNLPETTQDEASNAELESPSDVDRGDGSVATAPDSPVVPDATDTDPEFAADAAGETAVAPVVSGNEEQDAPQLEIPGEADESDVPLASADRPTESDEAALPVSNIEDSSEAPLSLPDEPEFDQWDGGQNEEWAPRWSSGGVRESNSNVSVQLQIPPDFLDGINQQVEPQLEQLRNALGERTAAIVEDQAVLASLASIPE